MFFLRGTLILALLALYGCRPQPVVTFTFGGDVMLAREGQPLFAGVDPWQYVRNALVQQRLGTSADYFLANLESPLTNSLIPSQTAGYDLCAPLSQMPVLQAGGISLVNLANNHESDCGGSDTRHWLEQAGIRAVGPDLTPTYLATPAGRVGLLAAEDVTRPLDEGALLAAVRQVRLHCDVLIVSLHWGNEYQSGISPRQQKLAQELADADVDVIWGTHPHVLQPIRWLNAVQGSHRTLVMYSLGNLLTDQWMNAATQQSALVTLKIQGKKLVGLELFPLQMQRSNRQLFPATAEAGQQIEDYLKIAELKQTGIILSIPAY